MNAVNQALTTVFDLLLGPLEGLGRGAALVIASGVFGVLAVIAFKYLSAQKKIRAAKGRIKAHLIEIRIYQDDLGIVAKAIGKVLVANFQYLALNLVPFAILALPFSFVLAQFVVRYAFDPLPLAAPNVERVAGRGTTIQIQLAPESNRRVDELSLRFPEGVVAVSPLVRVPSEGRAFQEIAVQTGGERQLEISLAGGEYTAKRLAAGEPRPRTLQGERGTGFWSALLWPAERAFEPPSSFERITFSYPDSDLGWLPGGVGGVLIVFLVSSMLFGLLALKPLKITI
jgi:hypothetical protein